MGDDPSNIPRGYYFGKETSACPGSGLSKTTVIFPYHTSQVLAKIKAD
jgi:hypothetical protein